MPPVDQLTTLSLEQPKPAGSLDGHGAGDHDLPYRFGRQPRAIATCPFSTRQFARLLVLRGKVAAGLIGADDRAAEAHHADREGADAWAYTSSWSEGDHHDHPEGTGRAPGQP